MYCFRRFGNWVDADIDGLANLMSEDMLDTLIKHQGTCILYTHLGKRKVERKNDQEHIPAQTKRAFENLKQRFSQKQLMVSATSQLLDYLIVRDHLEVDEKHQRIVFKPDGIRFQELTMGDLKALAFGFAGQGVLSFDVYIEDQKIVGHFQEVSPQHFTLTF